MPAVAGIPLDTIYQALGVSGPAPVSGSQDSAPALDSPLSTPDQLNATPGAPDQTAGPSSVSVSAGQHESVGTRSKGFSGQAYDQVVGKTKGVDAQLAAISSAQQQNLASLGAGYDQATADAKQAIANDTVAQQAKITAQGQEDSKLADMNQKMAIEESRQSAIAAQKVVQQQNNYEAALREFSAARVDPNQLWHSMRGYDKVGMLATAFVHDFLGAKGIHTSAIDTFNRAVDQNIAAQVENIKNKREAAEGFKTLWQMAQDQSRTEAEARLRVRGYMMESFKSQVASELAGYDSQLAATKGAAAQAAVEMEAIKNKADLSKVWQENANADKAALVSLAGHRIAAAATERAAQISAGASVAGKQIEARQKQQENAQKTAVRATENAPPTVEFGPDGLPHQVQHGTPVLGFGLTPEDATKKQETINTAYSLTREVNKGVEELKKVRSHYGGPGATKLQGVDAALVDNLRDYLSVSLGKHMGGVRADSSAQMREVYDKFFRKADWTTVDGVDKAIATWTQIAQLANESAANDIATLRKDPQDAALAGEGVGNESDPLGPSPSAPTFNQAERTVLDSYAHNRSDNPAEDIPAVKLAKEVQSDRGQDYGQTYTQDQGKGQEYLSYLKTANPDSLTSEDKHDLERPDTGINVPNWAENMMVLQAMATPNAKSANPIERGLPDQYTPEERKQALDMLTMYANHHEDADPASGISPLTGDQVLFARYLLSQVVAGQQ